MKKKMIAVLAVFALTACGEEKPLASTAAAPGDVTSADTSASAPVAASASAPAANGSASDGVRFDPAQLTRGRRLGDLFTEEAMLSQASALPDKPYLGRVRFSGTTELTGQLVQGADSASAPCFIPDAGSAARLPRMQGDARPLKICFQNGPDVLEILGPMKAPENAKIGIKNYVISYARDGVTNVAGLLTAAPEKR